MDKTGIYCFIDKQTNKVIYVGQAKALYQRLGGHYVKSGQPSAPLIDQMLYEDYERYEWKIIEECNVEELDTKELYWIQYYNTIIEGYNQLNKNIIEQVDLKTGEVINTFTSYAEAARAVHGQRSAICTCAHGKIPSAYGYSWRIQGVYIKQSISVPTRGKKRAVIAYDLQGNKLATYESSAAAARDLGVESSAIGHVLKGRQKTCKGRVFRYADEMEDWETKFVEK